MTHSKMNTDKGENKQCHDILLVYSFLAFTLSLFALSLFRSFHSFTLSLFSLFRSFHSFALHSFTLHSFTLLCYFSFHFYCFADMKKGHPRQAQLLSPQPQPLLQQIITTTTIQIIIIMAVIMHLTRDHFLVKSSYAFGKRGNLPLSHSLIPLPSSLFPLPSSLFPLPSSLPLPPLSL
jgi:hypothetical protein